MLKKKDELRQQLSAPERRARGIPFYSFFFNTKSEQTREREIDDGEVER